MTEVIVVKAITIQSDGTQGVADVRQLHSNEAAIEFAIHATNAGFVVKVERIKV